MLTFDLTPLARTLSCEAEVEAYSGPFVGWDFFATVLRAVSSGDAETSDLVASTIAGLDCLAKQQDWSKSEARIEEEKLMRAQQRINDKEREANWGWAIKLSAPEIDIRRDAIRKQYEGWMGRERDKFYEALCVARNLTFLVGWAGDAKTIAYYAYQASKAAARAGLPYDRQREILVQLMEEATDE